MSAKSIAFASLAVALLAAGCAQRKAGLSVSFEPGSSYSTKVAFGSRSLTMIPQIAIWIETPDGRFVDTVYASKKSASAAWGTAGVQRPEALPVWSHARGVASADGLFMPDARHPLPDAVSGATPEKAFAKTWKAPSSLVPGSYRIRVELNSSFDWNEAYPEKLPKTDPRWSEVNGQPSVVYEAAIELGGAASSAVLKPVGTGSLRGEDGRLTSSLEGLTTALKLAASIEAEFRP